MKKNFIVLLLGFTLPFFFSCSKKNAVDEGTGDRYAKSTTVNEIIERSGTQIRGGSSKDRELQLKDAENRLRTGGGLFGKKPTSINDIWKKRDSSQQTASIGMPINPYLWKASLETIDFMPLSSADPFAGIIITDWFSSESNINERCKLNIFIKGQEMKTDNLKVNSFCQALSDSGNWMDKKINTENNIKIENAILNKAKKIRLAQN